jgi:hypothetical protein
MKELSKTVEYPAGFPTQHDPDKSTPRIYNSPISY